MTMSDQGSKPGRFTLFRRGDPVREIADVYDRMGRLMQDFLGDGTPMNLAAAAADIEETDDAYIVDIELPGVRREDVNIELRDNELRISGEIKEKERVGVLRRRERRVGQFEHVVALPGDVDPEKVDANLSGGVLSVRVGKARSSQPRRIEVTES
jgi:HSP20 family protein